MLLKGRAPEQTAVLRLCPQRKTSSSQRLARIRSYRSECLRLASLRQTSWLGSCVDEPNRKFPSPAVPFHLLLIFPTDRPNVEDIPLRVQRARTSTDHTPRQIPVERPAWHWLPYVSRLPASYRNI